MLNTFECRLLKQYHNIIIGSNMIFYALTSAGPRGRCWNPSLKGFQRLPILSLENFGKKCFEKFFFPEPIIALKCTLPVKVLKTLLPGRRLTSSWRHGITFATMHITDDDVSFCDGPGMLIRKTVKPYINSTWFALLIHGFVPVKGHIQRMF